MKTDFDEWQHFQNSHLAPKEDHLKFAVEPPDDDVNCIDPRTKEEGSENCRCLKVCNHSRHKRGEVVNKVHSHFLYHSHHNLNKFK